MVQITDPSEAIQSAALAWWKSMSYDAKFQIKFENRDFDFGNEADVTRYFSDKNIGQALA